MAVKRGLNKAKGLSSLFPQNYQPSNHANEAEEAKDLPENKPHDKSNSPDDTGTSNSTETKKPASRSGKKLSDQGTEEGRNDNNRLNQTETEVQSGNAIKTGEDRENQARADELNSSAKGAIEIRISEIIPNKDQPRTEFDEASLDELTESIKQFGVIQPLLVQKRGKYFEIIAGERRWRAARKAGLKTVPAVIRDYSEKETVEISLIENIQRQDLNSIEEAKAYRRLLDEFGMTQDEVAKRVSKSRTAVTNSVRLLNLEEHVQRMVIDGDLSAGHARALLGLSDPELQRKAAEEVVRGELSVRETELLVKELLKPKKERRPKKVNEQLEAVYHEMENRLTEQIGTKVRIVHGRGKRGKIEIEYYSQDDLNRIIDLIH